MPPVLRVHNLWKSYAAGVRGCSARVWALRGCTLHVHAGDRIAIVGRGGAGKSTLLQCMAGLRLPDAGRVEGTFDRIIYTTGLPVPAPVTRSGRGILHLVDDLALPGAPDECLDLFDRARDPRATLIVAARHVAGIAPFVTRILTLRDGHLTALPHTPIRRVAERMNQGGEKPVH